MSEGNEKPDTNEEAATSETGVTTESNAGNATSPSGGFDLGIVIDQAKQVVTDPRGFYSNMAKSGGFSEPLIFLLVMGVVSGLLFGVLSLLGLTGAGIAGFGAVIFMPIGMLIGGFIGAAIFFVIWKLMGSPEDYETAYRCVAYSTAILPIVTVLGVIPYLGTIVRTVWSVWLMIIASETVHGRNKSTAQIVFGILAAIGIMTSLSGEYASRQAQHALNERLDQFESQTDAMTQSMKNFEKLGISEDGEVDPEQMGRAMGEFFKGMEEAVKQAEQEAAAAEEAASSGK